MRKGQSNKTIEIGQVFERLTVIGPVFHIRNDRGLRWPFVVCQCNCGAVKASGIYDLLN